jgi:hypothetical protein
MRTAPLPLLSLKRISSATGPNISPFVGPSSLNVSNVKESVTAKRTVKSHRTYMREGGWWNSVIVSVCMNKTWVIYA